MRAFVDDEEDRYERPKGSRDIEMTLGGGTVMLLVLGLVLVCGVCFGAGYFVGHRGTPAQVASSADSNAQAATPVGNSIPKPMASTQPAAPVPDASQTPPDAQPGSGDPTQAEAAVTTPAAGSAPGATLAAAPAGNTAQVHPALPAASAPAATTAATQTHTAAAPPQAHTAVPAQTHTAASAPQVQPAAMQLMVQIAAVSHPEDADVLIGALRKHGYTVTARHEADNLIHVRIGPFSTRKEAESWRMKLLNDGYNAMIQP